MHANSKRAQRTLPKIFALNANTDKAKFLKTYTLTYLKEEIVAEQITRKLEPFRQFLEISAQHNGKIINFSAIAKDVGVDTKTVQSYFQILEDTLDIPARVGTSYFEKDFKLSYYQTYSGTEVDCFLGKIPRVNFLKVGKYTT